MIRRALPVTALSLLVTLAAGCSVLKPASQVSLYDGPERSQTDIAAVVATDHVQLLAVDGKELSGSLFDAHETRFNLLPGEHVLSVRYTDFFQLNAENHEVVRSRPVALRFVAVAGETYRFQFDKPKTVDAANKFAKAPQLALVGERSGSRVESQAIRSFAEASVIDTISKAFQSDETKDAVRASQLPAPVASAAAPGAALSMAAPAQRPAASGNLHYDLLRDIWLRATPEERAGFLRWTQTPEAR